MQGTKELPRRVPESIYNPDALDIVCLTVSVGDTEYEITAEVSETIELQYDVHEVRLIVVDKAPYELVYRTHPVDTNYPNPDHEYELISLDYYADRVVYLEYGPDGARIGIHVDEVTAVNQTAQESR